MAGPTSVPILLVLWTSAFAEISSDFLTSNGTTDTKAGPKIVETMEVKKIKTYSHSIESIPMAYKAGIEKVMIVLVRSTHTMTAFFGRRSRYTPITGPKSNGGMVCSRPIMVIIRAEPVNS